jgi:hypothetical protein
MIDFIDKIFPMETRDLKTLTIHLPSRIYYNTKYHTYPPLFFATLLASTSATTTSITTNNVTTTMLPP